MKLIKQSKRLAEATLRNKQSIDNTYQSTQTTGLEYLQAYAAYVGSPNNARGFKSNKQKARYGMSNTASASRLLRKHH